MKKILLFFFTLLVVACSENNAKKDVNTQNIDRTKEEAYYDESSVYTEEEQGYIADMEIADKTEAENNAVGGGEEGEKKIDAVIGNETRIQPKLIKTADMRFRVKNVDLSTEKIEEKAKRYGAFISNSSLHSNNSEVSNYITIRVPADDFDKLLKEISTESEYMERKEISTEDVTEEYVDIQTRLRTKKEVEQRYIQILKERAKTVADVYMAEEQIRMIREEIEAKEGRLNYLQNQVSYSTIRVDIFQQVEYTDNPEELTVTFGHRFSDSVGSGWNVVVDIFLGVASLWPLWIVAAIIYFFVRRKIKNYKTTKS